MGLGGAVAPSTPAGEAEALTERLCAIAHILTAEQRLKLAAALRQRSSDEMSSAEDSPCLPRAVVFADEADEDDARSERSDDAQSDASGADPGVPLEQPAAEEDSGGEEEEVPWTGSGGRLEPALPDSYGSAPFDSSASFGPGTGTGAGGSCGEGGKSDESDGGRADAEADDVGGDDEEQLPDEDVATQRAPKTPRDGIELIKIKVVTCIYQ